MKHTRIRPDTILRACALLSVLFFLTAPGRGFCQEDLQVLSDWPAFKNASGFLYDHFAKQAYEQLRDRTSAVGKLRILGDWQQRQDEIGKILSDIAGPFPEKTPLNAQVVGEIRKEDFTVEHVIFESRPGFKVTSSLFIPTGIKSRKKAPAIIYCSGHSSVGYRSEDYQHMILNLVKKGFVVFAFDPVGQGERLEYFNFETGKSNFGPTGEHSWAGAQAFITGSSQANYMIWDGIRAIDYLFTRKEVDSHRIGITGRSGGGTQSAYIAAFDDRILAAAPENYLTDFTRLLQSRGPQDAEQNFCRAISRGLDHPDFLIVRAPKPALMILTYNDIFNIQGARDTYREAARIYELYGKKENLEVTEDFGGHVSTKKNREAVYAFFQKHLRNPGNPGDEEVTPLSAEEIRVTPTGQLSSSLGSETVFSLNRKQSEENHSRLRDTRAGWVPKVADQAKRLSGYKKPQQLPEPILTGIVQKKGFVIEKYFLMGEGDYPVPFLLYIPEKSNGKALLYLHPDGKKGDPASVGYVQALLKEGFAVLVPDLLGTGETYPAGYRGDAYLGGVSYNLWFASLLTGRSIAGVRAGDVERLAAVLEKDPRVTEISAIAQRSMSPVLLHAAVFAPVFKSIALIEPLSSYRAVVTERFYSPEFILNAVPGTLQYYDLPDLAVQLAPGRLLVADVVDGTGKKSDSGIVEEDLALIKKGYDTKGAVDSLFILKGCTPEKLAAFFQ